MPGISNLLIYNIKYLLLLHKFDSHTCTWTIWIFQCISVKIASVNPSISTCLRVTIYLKGIL